VNFSSIAARGNAGQAAYSAAKAGVEGLRAMAQQLGPLGIRVNAIAPDFIDVGSTRTALASDVLEQHAKRTPVRRLGGGRRSCRRDREPISEWVHERYWTAAFASSPRISGPKCEA
jgi:NAD(P)-dependent dehydrogenase (short-subunit alcohol dehydrogenase family)